MIAKLIRQPDQSIETKGDWQFINEESIIAFSCKTLELPWKDNQKRISCISKGIYPCRKVEATKAIPYPHISVMNVPDRDGISVHYGNFAAGVKVDTLGCIIAGERYADINGDGIDDITNSRKKFEALMSIAPDRFDLYVI